MGMSDKSPLVILLIKCQETCAPHIAHQRHGVQSHQQLPFWSVLMIASVADMIIMVKSDVFVGELDSNWSRLVRVCRMLLNRTIVHRGGGSPAIDGKTRAPRGAIRSHCLRV